MDIYVIVKNIVSLLKYLHKRGISHGSLYIKNISVQTKKVGSIPEFQTEVITGLKIKDFSQAFFDPVL